MCEIAKSTPFAISSQSEHIVIKNAIWREISFADTQSYANLTSVFINAFGEFLGNFPSRSINPDKFSEYTHTHEAMCAHEDFSYVIIILKIAFMLHIPQIG